MKMRVKVANEVFDVEVENLSARPIIAHIEGETFEVWPEDTQPEAQVFETRPALVVASAAAAPSAAVKSLTSVTSPLPGTILTINVKVGDTVAPGKELLVLEAMKMKNAIKATRAGTIAAIYVTSGQTVAHNQPLLDYAD
jgi:glutaconyl-CoA/methylmalonyl-CoA decarboxylase subunit gamma